MTNKTRKDGRPVGYVVPEQVKKRCRDVNPNKVSVTTPLGKFDSLNSAAQAHGMCTGGLVYRFKQGEIQRNNPDKLKYLGGEKNRTDYTGYYMHGIGKNLSKVKRPVTTPDGTFESVSATSKHYGITMAGVLVRIRDKDNWNYA